MLNIIGTRVRSVAVATGSLVLVGLGSFFALQDLGTAVKYAGIGSFFIGLIGAGMTATSLVLALRHAGDTEEKGSSSHEEDDARSPRDSPPSSWGSRISVKKIKNSTPIFDPQAKVVVNNHYDGGSRKRSKR